MKYANTTNNDKSQQMSKHMSGRFGELLLILLIVFVLFGAGKLPKVMADLGRGIRSLRDGINPEKDSKDSEGDKK